MATEIEYYDPIKYEMVTSQREYEQIGEIVADVPVGDYWNSFKKQVTELWLDPETGLVVGNIAAYERWITR